jgi:hypothetical protein
VDARGRVSLNTKRGVKRVERRGGRVRRQSGWVFSARLRRELNNGNNKRGHNLQGGPVSRRCANLSGRIGECAFLTATLGVEPYAVAGNPSHRHLGVRRTPHRIVMSGNASVPLAATRGVDVKGASADRRASERHNGEKADASRWAQPPMLPDPWHLSCLS